MKLFGAISKVSENPDGTLIVSGIASSEAKDSDNEIVKSSAIAEAIPDFMKFGALREMHQQIAAGTTLALEVLGSGVTHIEALVVDPVSVKKVLTGVLKGFSIGGRVTKRSITDHNIIEGIKLTEISLVDRPANPDAMITLYKADTIGDEPEDEEVEVKETGTPERTEEVAKSLYCIADLASVLNHAKYVQRTLALEETGSTIPDEIKEWISEGLEILNQMTQEELTPLMSQPTEGDMPQNEVIEEVKKETAKAEVVKPEEDKTEIKPEEKAEEEMMNISKKQYDMLQEAYKVMHKMFGNQEEAAKAESKDDLHKMQSELSQLKSELEKKDQDLKNLIDESTKAIKAVQAKGYLKAVAVSKEDDGLLKSDDSKPKSTIDLLKASFAAGKRFNP